jgi:hypothetical protein
LLNISKKLARCSAKLASAYNPHCMSSDSKILDRPEQTISFARLAGRREDYCATLSLLTERRVRDEQFSRANPGKMMMHPARATQSVAISASNMRERWLTLSLFAGSLALLAWCIVAI